MTRCSWGPLGGWEAGAEAVCSPHLRSWSEERVESQVGHRGPWMPT